MKIEKNVPIPRVNKHREVYPFHEMEVGDSFWLPLEKGGTLSAAASSWGVRNCRKFKTRAEDGGYRCWRIK